MNNVNLRVLLNEFVLKAQTSKAPAELVDEYEELVLLWSDELFASERRRWVKEMREKVEGMKDKNEVEEPRLFQNPSTPNQWGGYSSVPFYCSLCSVGEMQIQDNKMSDGNYHCACSVWTSSCGGKWVRWYKGRNYAQKLLNRYVPQPYNNALDAVLKELERHENV